MQPGWDQFHLSHSFGVMNTNYLKYLGGRAYGGAVVQLGTLLSEFFAGRPRLFKRAPSLLGVMCHNVLDYCSSLQYQGVGTLNTTGRDSWDPLMKSSSQEASTRKMRFWHIVFTVIPIRMFPSRGARDI